MKLKYNSVATVTKTGLLMLVLAALWCINCGQHLFAADFSVDNANPCVGSSVNAEYYISYYELEYLGWIEGNPYADFYNGNNCVASIEMTDDGYYGFYADYTYASPTSPSDDVAATLGAEVDEDATEESWAQQGVKWHVDKTPVPPPQPPVPDPRTVTLADGGAVSKTFPITYSIDGYYVYEDVVSGTAGPSNGSESFKKYDSLVTSLCGYGIVQQTYPLPTDVGWHIESIDLDVGLDAGEGFGGSVGVGVGIAYTPTKTSYNLFGNGESPDQDYVEWVGQPFEGDVTPTTTSFTGTVTYQEAVALGPNYGQVVRTFSTKTYTGQSLSLLNPTEHQYALYDKVSHAKCCPNNSH